MALGVSEKDIGFSKYLDAVGSKKLLELKSNDNGGLLETYSTKGNKTVFLGPENNSRSVLVVNALYVKNEEGSIVAAVSSDNKNNGFIIINTKKGNKRYQLSIDGNRAQSNYFNTKGKNVLSLGVYSNNDIGFTRYRDVNGNKSLLEIKSNNNGGILEISSPNVNKTVCLGHENSLESVLAVST